jgi:hypothetical protein
MRSLVTWKVRVTINVKGTTGRIKINYDVPVLGIRNILVRIQIRTSVSRIWDPEPSPFFSEFLTMQKICSSYFFLITYPQSQMI